MGVPALKYIAIPLSSLMGAHTAHVDLYLRLSEDRFVKVLKRGELVDLEQLRNYMGRKVTEAWVSTSDYPSHVERSVEVNEVVQKMFKGNKEWQYSSLQTVAESVFNELRILPINEVALDRAEAICISMGSNLPTMGLESVIREMGKISEDFVRHSVAVSFISVMLCESMSWKSKKTLKTMSLAGLLHDIGQREFPPELIDKHQNKMTPDELKLYQTHPQRGVDLLKDFKKVPAEVSAIIYDHHERANGSGFPRRLTREKIFAGSLVIAFADIVAHALVKTARNPEPKSPQMAINELRVLHQHDFSEVYWEAFRALIKRA